MNLKSFPDTSLYLKIKLLHAEGAPLTQQIAIGQRYKDMNIQELLGLASWQSRYKKKKGRRKSGMKKCDDKEILWFPGR